MRYLTVLLGLLPTVAALGHSDPFLPGLKHLGADPEKVVAVLTEAGLSYELETIFQSDGDELLYVTVDHRGLHLNFKFTDDEMLRLDGTSERGLGETRLREIIDDWWELLTAAYGPPDEMVTPDEADQFTEIRGIWKVSTWAYGAWTVQLFGGGYTSYAGEGLQVVLLSERSL